MPKKTTYSRSGAQRSRTKQKAFELVRPVSEENVLEADAESEQASVGRKTALKVEEIEETDQVEEADEEQEEADEVEKSVAKKSELVTRTASTKKIETGKKRVPDAKSTPVSETVLSTETKAEPPKSAAARMAARREAAQKAQHANTHHAISAENYAYVRKDLIFILILAVIMFSAIIVLHFTIGN